MKLDRVTSVLDLHGRRPLIQLLQIVVEHQREPWVQRLGLKKFGSCGGRSLQRKVGYDPCENEASEEGPAGGIKV